MAAIVSGVFAPPRRDSALSNTVGLVFNVSEPAPPSRTERGGAKTPEVMAAIVAYGTGRESNWPYDRRLFAVDPPPPAYKEASQYGAAQYARVDGSKGAISALAEEI